MPTVQLFHGDSREVLKTLPENSVDSVVCDPPYSLVSIVKRFGKDNSAPIKVNDEKVDANGSSPYLRASSGFMGKKWDTGETAFDPAFWVEVYRVLKPGGHLLAFGGTRSCHRLTCAIEDGGFEIRDMIAWVYGNGFPKSHNTAKAIDKSLGAERTVIGHSSTGYGQELLVGHPKTAGFKDEYDITESATDEARRWDGWGSALKPALEPVTMARKPLSESTIAANVLRWGTGAINIDGCRIAESDKKTPKTRAYSKGQFGGTEGRGVAGMEITPVVAHEGRWPANLITSGEQEVVELFPSSSSSRSVVTSKPGAIYGGGDGLPSHTGVYGFDDSGSNARYFKKCEFSESEQQENARLFYSPKASKKDRAGSSHPTVKPISLMAYLCRLVTPPNGTVLDPFAGSGTTLQAAINEGFSCIGIEREAEYIADCRRRLGLGDESNVTTSTEESILADAA